MHELGIVIQIVKQMEQYMEDHRISKIETLVLQVGELSGVYPKYLEDVYPIAVEGSKLSDTSLELDITPGIGQCKSCEKSYRLDVDTKNCPFCESTEYNIISGQDFLIKEVHVKEE